MDVCYIATFWLGGRRFPDARQVADPYWHLRQHAGWLRRVPHDLARIVFVLAVERAEDLGAVEAAIAPIAFGCPFHLLARHNVGISYGGFADAFDTFPQHRHYVLNEDDAVFVEPHFDQRLVEWMERSARIGCVVGHVHPVPPRHPGCFAGLYRGEALRAIAARLGHLPYSPTGLTRYIPNPDTHLSDYCAHESLGQVAYGRALETERYVLTDWGAVRSTPFWDQAGIKLFGNVDAPAFLVPSVALGRPVGFHDGTIRTFDETTRRFERSEQAV